MTLGKKLMSIGMSKMMNLFTGFSIDYPVKDVPQKEKDAVRVMTYNLRYADDLYGSVRVRSKLIAKIIESYMPDSFGVQEATARWLNALKKEIGAYYDCVYTFRDVGEGAETAAVFYLKDKYSLKASGTIWLSDTPDVVGSKFEDSNCTRICTWAVLENKETGKAYSHINTHLDHIGDHARAKQAKILCKKVRELLEDCDTLVCTGDFNTGESSIVYKEMLTTLRDSKYSAEKSEKGATFHDYGRVEGVTEPIDYVFITDNVKVSTYKIIRNTPRGMYPSDHYGISVDFNM